MDDEPSAWDIVTTLVDRGANVDVPLRQRVPYRTKIDRGADGILGAGTTPLLRAAKTGDAKDDRRYERGFVTPSPLGSLTDRPLCDIRPGRDSDFSILVY